MDTTRKLILGAVDDDIAAHFDKLEDGSYMTMLPLAINISRHLRRISALTSNENRCDSSNSSGNG